MIKETHYEYKLIWLSKGKSEELSASRLIVILKFIKNERILEYTISGRTKDNIWKVIMKIGK